MRWHFLFAVLLWVGCGVGAAGFVIAKANDGFDWGSKDTCLASAAQSQGFAFTWGLVGGPFSLFYAYGNSGFGYRGWTLRRSRCEDNRQN